MSPSHSRSHHSRDDTATTSSAAAIHSSSHSYRSPTARKDRRHGAASSPDTHDATDDLSPSVRRSTRNGSNRTADMRRRSSPEGGSRRHRERHRSRSPSHQRKLRSTSAGSLSKQQPKSESPITRTQRPPKRAWKFDSPPRGDGTDSRSDGIGSGTGLVASAASGPLDVNGVPGTISQLLSGDGPQQQSPMGLLAQSLGLSAEQQKASRELYIGNLPARLDVNQLIEFFNAAMLTLNASTIPGNPVSRAWIASDGHFAFVEFRTIEEATIGLQLNGLNCMGYALRLGRPKTYPAEYAALLGSTSTDGSCSFPSMGVSAGQLPNPVSAMLAAQAAAAGIVGVPKRVIERRPDRLVILDMPPSAECSEADVKGLLGSFGTLKIFQYFEVPETSDSPATGVCVFEYGDYKTQEAMEKGMPDRVLAGKKLRVVLAEDAIREGSLSEVITQAAQAGLNLQEELGGELMKPQVPTRVIMLTNLVTRQDLIDDKEYFDIVDDVHIECSHYGKVVAVEIPRPLPSLPEGIQSRDDLDESDIGCAFVKFARLQGAGAARRGLSGRKFAGHTVEAQYFSEMLFNEKKFKNPQPNYDASGRLPESPTEDNDAQGEAENADGVHHNAATTTTIHQDEDIDLSSRLCLTTSVITDEGAVSNNGLVHNVSSGSFQQEVENHHVIHHSSHNDVIM